MDIIPTLGKSFLSQSDVFSGGVKEKRDWKDSGKLQDFSKNLTANDGGKRKLKYLKQVLLKSLLNLENNKNRNLSTLTSFGQSWTFLLAYFALGKVLEVVG